jgi:hypothetical protein
VPASSITAIKPERQAIAHFAHAIMHPGEVHVVVITDSRRGPMRFYGRVAGAFNQVEALVQAVAPITGKDAAAVFMTMNPAHADLLARWCNRLEVKVEATIADEQITRRRHLLIETDPIRLAGTSATDEEVRLALERRDAVWEFLTTEHGWGNPVVASQSPNGGGLLYKVDLPNDDAATDLVRRVLAAVAGRFSDSRVELDQSVFNAARLTKIIGTVGAKGEHFVGHPTLPDRPHRLATAIYPDWPALVSIAQLEGVAADAPQPQPRARADAGRTTQEHTTGSVSQERREWMEQLLSLNGLHATPRPYKDGIRYRLDRCLSSDEHTDGAALFLRSDGTVAYDCKHSRCAGKKWATILEQQRVKLPDAADGSTSEASTPEDDRRNGHKQGQGAAGGHDRAAPSESRSEQEQAVWPTLDDAALHGLAGDIVRAIEPHTEADPAVLLFNVLVSFGNAAGREAYAVAEGKRHGTNIDGVVVGDTSKGRKGSSRGRVEQLFELADVVWVNQHIVCGLSSGEGLIYAVRDAGDRRDKEGELVDAGVIDKRLLVVEEEFCTVLKVMAREGNTLSAIIRQAWDSGNLRVLNKNSPIRATGAHISVIGHATRPELRRDLTDTEAANGFGNRFLWLCSRRSKCLPEGGGTPNWGDLDRQLHEALVFARSLKQPMTRNDDARALWAEVYPSLSEGRPGLVGALTSRAEAQVLRLSVIYAVMDRSPVVRPEHLLAALALWDYAEASARYIFGNASGNPAADRILSALKDAGSAGMTSTQISALFSRHTKAAQIHAALNELESAGLAGHKTVETDGRPCAVYHAL